MAGALARVAPAAGRGEVRALVPVIPDAPPASRRGSLVPLQRLRLTAFDPESLMVRRLVARVRGVDPAFRVAVVRDANGDGRVSPGETVLARSMPVALAGAEQAVTLPIEPGAIVVPRGGAIDLLLAGELSGASPHDTEFSGELVADAEGLVGTRSGALLALGEGTTSPAVPVRTTVLAEGERVSLAQNPVRHGPLVISFDGSMRRMTVLDFAGRRVRSIAVPAEARRVEWDLRNDAGLAVANGAYVLVLDLPSGMERRTLFVAR